MGLGGLVLGSLILYLKGTRIVMFQLSGFYYITVQYMRVPKRSERFLSGLNSGLGFRV